MIKIEINIVPSYGQPPLQPPYVMPCVALSLAYVQSTNFCSDKSTETSFFSLRAASTAPIVEKAQHEPQEP
jgi:hypothetical protein